MHTGRTLITGLALTVAIALPAGGHARPNGSGEELRAALSAAATLAGVAGDLPTVQARTFHGLPYADALGIVVPAVETASRLRASALSRVTDDQIAFAATIGQRVIDAPGSVTTADATRAAAIIARIDMRGMLTAASIVTRAIEEALPHLKGSGPPVPTCSPGNVVCIGTTGDDTWTEDVQILIDPGGDDTYLNNAGGVLNRPAFDLGGGCAFGGGTTGRARPNLGCMAGPGTVCTYDTANGATGRDDLPVVGLPGHDDPDAHAGNGTDGSCMSTARMDALLEHTAGLDQDADSRGIAVLIDAGGSDTYTVPWSHEDPLFDLIDFCYPDEHERVNTNRDLFQGSALAGVGVLWDAGDGDDVYRGRLNAQGTGHVGGVGVLVTDGTGDATFWADRLAQGNGIAGGIGMLVNTKVGQHTYLLDPPVVYRNEFRPNGRDCAQEGRAGQGQGGFGGLGILWNANDGDAVYRSVVHLTKEAHPFDPIVADGAPVLVEGSDAQGSGESFPIVDTPGGIVAGLGLLMDRTDGDASVCPGAGMHAGSSTSTGVDLSTMGIVSPCGTFNLPAETQTDDLGLAIQRLLAGAVGVRVVA